LLTGTVFVSGTYCINRKVRKGGARGAKVEFGYFSAPFASPFAVKGTLHRILNNRIGQQCKTPQKRKPPKYIFVETIPK